MAMQIVLNVMARPSTRKSLRETVIADLQSADYGLEVVFEKKIGRRRGWAKIRAAGLKGALNISWHAPSKMLIARAVSKKGNTPGDLVSRFVRYLLERRRRDFTSLILHTLQ
jgi:hypothetical protein